MPHAVQEGAGTSRIVGDQVLFCTDVVASVTLASVDGAVRTVRTVAALYNWCTHVQPTARRIPAGRKHDPQHFIQQLLSNTTLHSLTYITNLFRRTNIKIAFHTNNTVYNRLTHKNHNTDKYTQSGVYKLTCPDCSNAYVGQTGRSYLA